MKDSEKAIRKVVDDLVSGGADRHVVLPALNSVALDLLTTLMNETKTSRTK